MNSENTEFRIWLNRIWLEFCEERQAYNDPVMSIEEYFQTYKYWLKREFQNQKKLSNSNHIISMVLDDKLDSSEVRLLSDQQKYIKTLKDGNEK